MSEAFQKRAYELFLNGLRPIPFRVGAGSQKAPALKTGFHIYRQATTPFDREKVVEWFPKEAALGVGVFLGETGQGLFVVDIEYLDFAEKLLELMAKELPSLKNFPIVLTPGKTPDGSGGRHFYFRYHGASFAKLASIDAADSVSRTGSPSHTTAIEILAHGNQVLVPGGHPEAHPSGRHYRLAEGSPDIWEAPLITKDQYETLIDLCCSLSKAEVKDAVKKHEFSRPSKREDGKKRPGDDFDERGPEMGEIIKSHFTFVYERDGVQFFRRNGKKQGISASYGFAKRPDGVPLLYVFSSNASPFRYRECYSKFSALVFASYGGDFGKAARDLSAKNYGDKIPPRSYVAEASSPDGEKLVNPITDHIVEEFPLWVFPPAIQRYCRDLSDAMDAPVDFAACSIISVASAAIGTTRKIELAEGHRLFCSIFLALVAPPGGKKSPILWQVADPVERLSDRLDKEYQEAFAKWEVESEEAKEANAIGPPRPIYERVCTRHFTVESLMPILSENPRGLLVLKDEISGLITGQNAYRGGKGSDRQFFLEVWSSIAQHVDRKSQGAIPIRVPDPFLSIVGGIQPDVLPLLTEPLGADDGFADRFLFSYPVQKPCLNYNIDARLSEQTREIWRFVYNQIFQEIRFVDPNDIDFSGHGYKLVRSSREALKLYSEWWNQHMTDVESVDFPPRLKGPFLKMRDYVARFALIIHVLRQLAVEEEEKPVDPEVVDEETMRAAIALGIYFKSHACRAHGVVIRNKEDKLAHRAISYILRKKDRKVGTREFMMNNKHLVQTAFETRSLFYDLEDRGWGQVIEDGNRLSFQAHESRLTTLEADLDREDQTDS